MLIGILFISKFKENILVSKPLILANILFFIKLFKRSSHRYGILYTRNKGIAIYLY